jgi:uncharacterized membrane protein
VATSWYGEIYYFALVIVMVAFFTTLSMWMVYCYDRDRLKRKASLHEIVSIMFLGLVLAPLSISSAAFIAIAPILWYLSVNSVMHSGILNPDI